MNSSARSDIPCVFCDPEAPKKCKVCLWWLPRKTVPAGGMGTPMVPDRVPYFVQGAHQEAQGLRARSLLPDRQGRKHLISTVQLDGDRYETRIFPNHGQGPSMEEFCGIYWSEEEAQFGHELACNLVFNWRGEAHGPLGHPLGMGQAFLWTEAEEKGARKYLRMPDF